MRHARSSRHGRTRVLTHVITALAAASVGLTAWGEPRALAVASMGTTPWSETPALAASVEMTERFERALLAGKNAPGVLVPVGAQETGRGIGVTIHGINASAADVAPLSRELSRTSTVTFTFAYDDNYRRLEDTTDDLVAALRAQLAERPGEPLRIWAHSMGARVALVAIARLAACGELAGRDVELELVAPALAGYKSANFARLGSSLLSGIKNVRPALDLGTTSRYQRELESLVLPEHVRVRVFLAGHDHLIDADHPRLRRVVTGVGADLVRLPGTNHDSSVAAAATWLHDQQNLASLARVPSYETVAEAAWEDRPR